jgi:23S rRNA (uracil1939-C5)-methyltransferase
MAEVVTVAALGAGGDAVAEVGGAPVFVPFALPGETVAIERAGNRGRLVRVVTASPERVSPVCPYFGTCGGCGLQHMERHAYLAWKRAVVVESLRLHGIDAPVEPVVASAPGSRRRAVFAAVKTTRGVVLGFNRRKAHEIVPVDECAVLAPAIVNRLPALHAIAVVALKPGKRARISVVLADNGLDIAIEGAGRLGGGDRLERLGRLAGDPSLARLTVDDTTVFENRRPEIASAGAAMRPTPGGFLQAVPSAEDALAAAVLAHVGDTAPVADLFAGIGTFTLRLAHRAPVTAVDGDAVLLAALDDAVRHATGLKPVTARRRDLFVNPMSAAELNAFGAVVFDPPAAGARRQAEAIARSSVPKVAAVSCNPATLGRDARILIDAGYRLTRVLPVDQFLWSAQIEVVAAFAR